MYTNMIVIQNLTLSEPQSCQYLPDREWRFRYFFASDLDSAELEMLLSRGWRKFGFYYFKPSCEGCASCVPLRVLTREFQLNRNLKEVAKKNRNTEVTFGPLEFSDEIYEIYRAHSIARFGNSSSIDEFLMNFYMQSCPAIQSEYYIDGSLAAVGFLDRSESGLSSVYFCFDPAYSSYSLGTYGAIREIRHASEMGLPYYYLGYYIGECERMRYKNRFRPNELYSWGEEEWRRQE